MLYKKNKDGSFQFICDQNKSRRPQNCCTVNLLLDDFVGRFNGKEHNHGQTLTLEQEKVFWFKIKKQI